MALSACAGSNDTINDSAYPKRGDGDTIPVLPGVAVPGTDELSRDFAWGPHPDRVLFHGSAGSFVADLEQNQIFAACGVGQALRDSRSVDAMWVEGRELLVLANLSTSNGNGLAHVRCTIEPLENIPTVDEAVWPADTDWNFVSTTFSQALVVRDDGAVFYSQLAEEGPAFVDQQGNVVSLTNPNVFGFLLHSDQQTMFRVSYIDLFEADRQRQAASIVVERLVEPGTAAFETVATIEGPFVLRDYKAPLHASDRGFAGDVQRSDGAGGFVDEVLLVDFETGARVEIPIETESFTLGQTEIGVPQPDVFTDGSPWVLLPNPQGYGPLLAVNLQSGEQVQTAVEPPGRTGASAFGVVFDGNGYVREGVPRTTLRVRTPIPLEDAVAPAPVTDGVEPHSDAAQGQNHGLLNLFESAPAQACSPDDECPPMYPLAFHFSSGDSFAHFITDASGNNAGHADYTPGRAPIAFGEAAQLWWVDGRDGLDARVLATGVRVNRDLLALAATPWFVVDMYGDDTGSDSTHATTLTGWHVRDGVAVPAFDRQRVVYPRWGSLDGALVWGHRGFYRVNAPQ